MKPYRENHPLAPPFDREGHITIVRRQYVPIRVLANVTSLSVRSLRSSPWVHHQIRTGGNFRDLVAIDRVPDLLRLKGGWSEERAAQAKAYFAGILARPPLHKPADPPEEAEEEEEEEEEEEPTALIEDEDDEQFKRPRTPAAAAEEQEPNKRNRVAQEEEDKDVRKLLAEVVRRFARESLEEFKATPEYQDAMKALATEELAEYQTLVAKYAARRLRITDRWIRDNAAPEMHDIISKVL
jgi:hypothetical protein